METIEYIDWDNRIEMVRLKRMDQKISIHLICAGYVNTKQTNHAI
jgi:hypothetical protein